MTSNGWTSAGDIRAGVLRLWDRGRVLSAEARDDGLFPLRLSLKRPTNAEFASQFAAARGWIAELESIRQTRVERRQLNHRQLGSNEVPAAIWIDTIEQAAALIGRAGDLARFRRLVSVTRERRPELMPLVVRRPLDALAVDVQWSTLLDVVDWVADHPRSGLYVRQLDLPGVHTKFVEQHERLLGDMLELVLSADAIDGEAARSNFTRRFGFRERPVMIRFRFLDESMHLTSPHDDRNYAATAADFARLGLVPERVFITENEINFLAFPDVGRSMVVFGAGYGFERLRNVRWLTDVPIHYWGDIDTHGFVILDQLRGVVPHAVSMLMDRDTLMDHRSFWAAEDKPVIRDLERLTRAESDLYDDLRDNRIQRGLRLEQERIRFGRVREAIAACVTAARQL